MGEVVIFNGLGFKQDIKTGYYLCSKMVNGKRPRLHHYVWEFYNGEIPKGLHVHHIDKNKNNNDISNLKLMAGSKHTSDHSKEMWAEKKEDLVSNLITCAGPKAKEWHGSEKGKEWHSGQGKKNWEKMRENKTTKQCAVCGKDYETVFPARSKYCGDNCKMKQLRKRFKESGKDYTYGHSNKRKNKIN